MSVNKTGPETVLVIDDDLNMATLVEGLLSSKAQVTISPLLAEGVRLAAKQRFDLIVLDHRLPDGRGLEKIPELMSQDRLRPILYITAQSGSQTAIEAIKLGAFDYLAKPIDFEHFKNRLEQALEYRRLTRSPVIIDSIGGQGNDAEVLVGRCQAMQEVYKAIGRLSRLDAPVLIEGEVGTGKELVGRTIHEHSRFAQQKFTKLSSEDLSIALRQLDAQVAEHASQQIELLSPSFAGTIFVEELFELGNADQGRLFRVLQLLSRTNLPKFRIIVANSLPSHKLLESGKIRSDLFYFLSPYLVSIPALRDRGADLDLLVSHFMQCLAHVAPAIENQGPPRVSASAMELLHNYNWPGNVAQLKSVLQGVLMESVAAVLATDKLTRALTSGVIACGSPQPPASLSGKAVWNIAEFVAARISAGSQSLYEEALLTLEQALLQETLNHTRGNQAQAAKLLGITRTSLRKKIAQAGINVLKLTAHESTDEVLN